MRDIDTHQGVLVETRTVPRELHTWAQTLGTLRSRKSLPQPGSRAQSAPGLFSERHSQPRREKNPLGAAHGSLPALTRRSPGALIHPHTEISAGGGKSMEKGRTAQLSVGKVEEEISKSERGISVQAASPRLR